MLAIRPNEGDAKGKDKELRTCFSEKNEKMPPSPSVFSPVGCDSDAHVYTYCTYAFQVESGRTHSEFWILSALSATCYLSQHRYDVKARETVHSQRMVAAGLLLTKTVTLVATARDQTSKRWAFWKLGSRNLLRNDSARLDDRRGSHPLINLTTVKKSSWR